MRLPASAHTSQAWHIDTIASDFRLEDVWLLPGDGDLASAVEYFTGTDPARSSSAIVRALFALRFKLGEIFGWDDDADGSPRFTPLYASDDEWAAELANRTMHGILHLGRTPEGQVQLAVLVKPNGCFGEAYMAAIRPFRHRFVYPALLRDAGAAL
jgi:hypothetical protein